MAKTIIATIIAYCLAAYLVFGHIIAPMGLLIFARDRLGLPGWGWLVLASVIAAGVAAILVRKGAPAWCSLPTFVALSIAISSAVVGVYADRVMSERTNHFAADVSFQQSFFQSVRRVGDPFSLHAGAMKRCVPYAWSYRTMSFYELPANVAVNVLPNDWLARCSIHRS